MSLAHSIVVILGGSSGIGFATAKAAKAEGARVVVTGRSADRLKSAPLLGADARTVALDVADEAGTRTLAVDLAPTRVNTIQPGYVDTPMLDELLGEARNAIKAETGAHLPVKRIGRPEEIADAVLFLMKNGHVNGITLTVDGGGLLV
jgi:NAD(P)-dependent dehydrogenase (short-subunit alcohol dehydrogenase family)